MIPTVDFFGAQVTRLILGDNPFNGHSYIRSVVDDDEMMDYYTANKCVEALFEAEANGINTYCALGSPFILRVLRQYRNEGGKMHILFQSYPAIDLEVNVRMMMACEPIAIYHQGGSLDLMSEEDDWDLIRNRLKIIRDSGVAVGFGTHVPETVARAERENWDVDFYFTCLYNARRTQRGQKSGFITGKSKELVFFPEDPAIMYETIKAVKKPCVAFKIYAGGQIFLGKTPEEMPAAAEKAVKNTFANIKPDDMICIGAFQKKKNEIKENADIVKRALSV